jgi:hypothetical protein
MDSPRRSSPLRPSLFILFQGYNQDAVGCVISTFNVHLLSPKCSPMTETTLVASPPPTPLATLLESSAKPYELAAYRGTLTPRQLDAPAVEIEALVSGAASHDLGWLRRVAVRGEDRFRWLSGMVTNMVNDLAPNAGTWNLVLNAQGRILGDLYVWREGEALEIEIAADQYDRLIAHLNHFIIMDDVELVHIGGEAALGLTGPMADQMLSRLGLPTLPEPLTGTRLEWNGVDLRIMRGYGVLAPHYELWVPEAKVAKVWKALRPGRVCLPQGVSHCRGDSRLWRRYRRAGPGAGDLADAGAPLQQGLLSGPGNCRAHPFAGQCAPPPALS